MSVTLILILLGTGLAIGFISALLGIGGGIIMTPVQYWLYTSQGLDPDVAIKIAFATSLAVILPTAASGVWRYHLKGSINWKVSSWMGIFTALGSFTGASIAAHISGSILTLSFGVMALIIALRMLTAKIKDTGQPIRTNLWLWFALAFPIGIITGILGIGGGVLVIPALVLVLRFPMHSAVATSLGMMLFTSFGGILGYIINGWQVTGLPEYTLGYIYWPVWIILALTSMIMAQVGAIVSQKVPTGLLKYLLTALLLYTGLDMIGAIDRIIALFK